ncbi:MAG: GTPase ObgE [Armatimonadia bacterium]
MADFVDVATIEVESGKGGDGLVHFRRIKFVPRAGPGGGDGGKGGDVILRVDPHMRTLLDFKYKSFFRAEQGANGGSFGKTGGGGQDLIVRVPPGTVVFDEETGQQVADLVGPGYELIAAKGGRGGRGNERFKTSTRQAPNFAEGGVPEQHFRLRLELKLLADVGIIGFPSVGKSTLISRISAAKPKIADYHFTTLTPNLGVVRLDENREFVVADMPGLIEGASEGIGLGHEFLRHVERTRVLIHLLDASGIEGRDPLQDFETINRELALYSEKLASLPQIVALNKVDLTEGREYAPLYRQELEQRGHRVLEISAATGEGLLALMQAVWDELAKAGGPAPMKLEEAERVVLEMPAEEERELRVQKLGDGVFAVSGTDVEMMMARADLQHGEGIQRAQRALEKMGVILQLEELGAQLGDTVFIGETEMEYRPDDI